jgi:serine/threonine protein kinase
MSHDSACTHSPAHTREQYMQSGHVSELTDAFSFGIVLIELLTGLHPIEARTLADAEGNTCTCHAMCLALPRSSCNAV